MPRPNLLFKIRPYKLGRRPLQGLRPGAWPLLATPLRERAGREGEREGGREGKEGEGGGREGGEGGGGGGGGRGREGGREGAERTDI